MVIVIGWLVRSGVAETIGDCHPRSTVYGAGLTDGVRQDVVDCIMTCTCASLPKEIIVSERVTGLSSLPVAIVFVLLCHGVWSAVDGVGAHGVVTLGPLCRSKWLGVWSFAGERGKRVSSSGC